MFSSSHTPLRSASQVLGLLLAGSIAVASTPAFAAEAPTFPSDSAKPDAVTLLVDYKNYWEANQPFDSSQNVDGEDGTSNPTFGDGEVINKTVLQHNDLYTYEINHAAAAGGDGQTATLQQKRALLDADYSMEQTLPDGLGPVLGEYFLDGLEGGEDGDLGLVYQLLVNNADAQAAANSPYKVSLLADYLNTENAKKAFNHPRPYVPAREKSYVGLDSDVTASDGQGIADDTTGAITISKVPDTNETGLWTDLTNKHSAGYTGFYVSGSFPSGHTTYAFSGGIGLATLLPELAPEILARASEAGNNRIVLGVHYPLDIMGGRIAGEAANTARWSDETFRDEYLLPAREQLVAYLTSHCEQDGYGDTLEACIANTGANADKGYTNDFADVVSTKPVTDRSSAIAAYESRLTYGFQQVGVTGQAATIPSGAENLLLTAYPSLNDTQRRQVLAATEIESGYPLDADSDGYQRLNLAAALSARVTVKDGEVVKVEPGQKAPEVIVVDASDNPIGDGQSTGNEPALAQTGVDIRLFATTALVLAAGGTAVLTGVRIQRRSRG